MKIRRAQKRKEKNQKNTNLINHRFHPPSLATARLANYTDDRLRRRTGEQVKENTNNIDIYLQISQMVAD